MADPGDLDGLVRPDRPDPAWVSREVAALSALVASGVEVGGQLQVAESTWFIYGHISYDGEVVVAEYEDAVAASAVLRAFPQRRPAPGGRVM